MKPIVVQFLGGPWDGMEREVLPRQQQWVTTNAFQPAMMHVYKLEGGMFIYDGLVPSVFSASP